MTKKKRKYTKRKQTKKKLPVPPKVRNPKIDKITTIVLFNMFVFFVMLVFGVMSKVMGTLLVGFFVGMFTLIINSFLIKK